MDKMNFDDNLSQIKMEKAKAAAAFLNESWGGNQGFTPGAAGSYVDGRQKEVEQISSEDIKLVKPSFSVGVLETAMALKQTSFVELPEAKVIAEKYINHVAIKGISEAFLIEGMIQELENFAWEKNAKHALDNLKKTYESNRREIEVAKAIEEINGSGGKDLFSTITEAMRNWLTSDDKVSEKLLRDLNKWGFNPTVRTLVERINYLESNNQNKFSIKVKSENCDVKSIIAPSLVTENSSIFVTSNRFFRATENGISVLERADASKLPGKFLKAVLALSNTNVKINESGLDMYIGKNKLSVVFESETDTKAVYLNSKRIPQEKLGFVLSFELRNSFQSSAAVVEQATEVVSAADYLSEVDFGKKIVSKVYEGVEANIFKFGEKVYVHRVNPAMKKNELLEGNGSQAVNMVKEFLGFDISESMTNVLEKEAQVISIMKNDKEAIKANLSIVENEMNKINKAIELNPRLADSDEIKEAKEMLVKESTDLKAKWNQINVEIERFEKGAKKISKVNESEGYGINTEVKVKRNGEKGTVVGVNGNSKTYTVMFENGRTGEFFYNDVINISDEISNANLEVAGDLTEDDEANEGLDANMELANAPLGKSGKDKKFVENHKNAKLAQAPGGKAAGTSADIENLKDHSLAEAPVRVSSKSKDPKGVSGNHELSAAPGSKTGKDKKFVENHKNANLAQAPGGSAAGSSKFVEDLNAHNLAESQDNVNYEKAPAPKSKKLKVKKIGVKKSQLAEAPGNHNKNGKKDHEPLNRATLAKAPAAKKK